MDLTVIRVGYVQNAVVISEIKEDTMSDINVVIVVGRLTRDPEAKSTGTGKTLTTFSIANSIKYSDKEKTSFFDCVAWGKTGEVVAQYCKKGNRVAIEGRLEQRSWEDKEGKKRQTWEIAVDKIQFLTQGTGAQSTAQADDEIQF